MQKSLQKSDFSLIMILAVRNGCVRLFKSYWMEEERACDGQSSSSFAMLK
jgi:hypothetical protein